MTNVQRSFPPTSDLSIRNLSTDFNELILSTCLQPKWSYFEVGHHRSTKQRWFTIFDRRLRDHASKTKRPDLNPCHQILTHISLNFSYNVWMSRLFYLVSPSSSSLCPSSASSHSSHLSIASSSSLRILIILSVYIKVIKTTVLYKLTLSDPSDASFHVNNLGEIKNGGLWKTNFIKLKLKKTVKNWWPFWSILKTFQMKRCWSS